MPPYRWLLPSHATQCERRHFHVDRILHFTDEYSMTYTVDNHGWSLWQYTILPVYWYENCILVKYLKCTCEMIDAYCTRSAPYNQYEALSCTGSWVLDYCTVRVLYSNTSIPLDGFSWNCSIPIFDIPNRNAGSRLITRSQLGVYLCVHFNLWSFRCSSHQPNKDTHHP